MSEWWTYTLSDLLMFSAQTYYRLFELYNREIWPAQIVAIGLGIVALLCLRRAGAREGRIVAAILAACWLWVAWAFQIERYATINWAARYFALGFAIEALLLIWIGVIRGQLLFWQSAKGIRVAGFYLFLFAGDIVPIGVKDTALLYEYWCFLKMVDLLRARFDLAEQTVVKVNRFRTTVTLAKGITSAMRFVHRPTNQNLYVVYNRMFDRLPTIAQKPDNVIQLANDKRFYIFDAKYRIQFDKRYLGQYGGPGPTTEDINTMHRYRDAIAIPHPLRPKEYLKGVVQGAVVLFPFSDEEAYQSHKFYKSIPQVEIGGLPFLPNATALVSSKLDALLANEFSDGIAAEKLAEF